MAGLDLDLVRHALSVAREKGFAEVELCLGEESFTAVLDPVAKPKRPKPAADADGASEGAETVVEVKSPLVGYYRSPGVAVGAQVKRGDVVAVVAALGIANDVESTADGEVVEVLVEDGQPVEYGQVLMRLRP